MNTCIEHLNLWGESFLGFAWPMLWQSSLLILVVFVLDYLLARRVRAAIRHALWLVVLVKLLLPPALALPTGAVWWLWPAKPALTPVIKTETVTFGSAPLPEDFLSQSVPLPVPPPPKLSGVGWAMLASGIVSAGLLFSLLLNWLKVERKARRAASGDFVEVMEEARQLAGLSGPARLRLVDDAISPAVYGLFRPVILLPRALAIKLSVRQLRVILLHEAMHLRRGDVWVNCAQTLLQIAYWWHPLLWLANARIRRLREEAVDDAVMVALRGDADAYAPTLLEVAKFAFRRPLASLGLVGILESRSALRQRVERLVDFRPPRRAGLTFLSLCGIFLFGAVTLPMGQAPASENNTTVPDKAIVPPQPGIYAPVNTPSAVVPAGVTNHVATQEFPGMPKPEPGSLKDETNGPASPGAIINTTTGRKDIYRKLTHIRLDTVSFQNLPLSEVIQALHEQSQLRDPDKTGINFLFAPPARQGTLINPATGLPENAPAVTNTAIAADIQINLKLTGVSLANLLDAICMAADHPIKYSIEDYGVVFADKDPNAAQYEMRTFKIDADKLLGRHVRKPTPGEGDYPPDTKSAGGIIWATTSGKSEADIEVRNEILKLTKRLGVNLDPPKSVFYNERLEVLFVYATPADLDVIERAIFSLNVGTDNPPDKKQQAAALANDGQMLYEMGRLEEAQAKLKAALALDPENKTAQYYLNLISQAKTVSESSQDTIHASHVPFVVAPIHPSYQPVSAPVNPDDLITNDFQINVAAFSETVREQTGEPDAILGLKKLAAKAGMDLSPPEQVSITTERFGEGLCIIATRKDMGTILRILDGLHCFPPQIHIKARFIEVPKTFFEDAGNSIPSSATNGGILTKAQFLKFLRQLQSEKDSEELAEPEVTTLVGRQTQMRATIIQEVVTNFTFDAGSPVQRVASVSPQVTKAETGPILDVLATDLPDGYTIDLKAIPSIIKFYGYADTKGLSPSYATNSDGQKIEMPITIPVFSVGEVMDEGRLYDGQTLVLLPKPQFGYNGYTDEKYRDRIIQHIQQAQKKEGDKQLIVLVTATLIDPVGNRVHSDADMAFAKNRVPQQPVIWDLVPVP
ncbi:MAG TPA: M56 family metallopeptidase [Pseudomonadales bacterium]|nr:M56 family metallopeptidase [Pseudomonadales bacterium]